MRDRTMLWFRLRDGNCAHAFGFAGAAAGQEVVSQCNRWFEGAALVPADAADRQCLTCRLVLDSWQATAHRARSA